MAGEPDYSFGFYRSYSARYAEVARSFRQSTYVESSHVWLKNDWDLLRRAERLSPGHTALDAGCGAGARDVYKLWSDGYDAHGVDAVEENIENARTLHPELAERVSLADLRQPLPWETGRFDLVLCNAVIQHIPRQDTFSVTLPELVRVLRPGGLLQLMFKHGDGILTLYDGDYGTERSFLLYKVESVLRALSTLGMDLVDTPEEPGSVLLFTDSKGAPHCALHARKDQ